MQKKKFVSKILISKEFSQKLAKFLKKLDMKNFKIQRILNFYQKAPSLDIMLYDSVAAEENFLPVAAQSESLDEVDDAYKCDFEDEKISVRKNFRETFIWDKIEKYAKKSNFSLLLIISCIEKFLWSIVFLFPLLKSCRMIEKILIINSKNRNTEIYSTSNVCCDGRWWCTGY